MLIAHKPVVNESKQEAELLVENLMPPPPRLLRQSARELKPRRRPRKRPRMENEVEHDISVEVEALNESLMRTEGPQDRLVTQTQRTDLGETTGKNPSDRLVRPAQLKFAKSVTETSNKVREPKTYDETINNPIHGNRWKEVIDEELWNLDSHQT